MKISAPGIYTDFPNDAYFADPCPEPSFTQSLVKVLLDGSPLHARQEHPRLSPPDLEDEEAEKYVKAQAIGNAAHKMILGRGKEVEIIAANDFRSKDAQTRRDAAIATGKVPILEKHLTRALAMKDAAKLQLAAHEARDAFTGGNAEVMIAWQEDGIWFRSLIDWLSEDLLRVDDFKTSALSMADHVIGLRAESAGWAIQAAFIERGLDVLDPTNAGRRKFRFIAQENYKPFALNVMVMDEYWLTMGRKKIAFAIDRWKVAMQANRWMGYGKRALTPEYSGFKETQWLKREIEAGESEHDPKLIMAG